MFQSTRDLSRDYFHSRTTEENLVEVSIGLSNLPSQIHRSRVINGFDLNMMIIGEPGIGKSTFINMLFETDIYVRKSYTDFSIYHSDSLEIKSSLVNLNEKGFNVRLEVVDVQGYGRSTPLDSCWDNVGDYLAKRLNDCIEHEAKIDRDAPFRDPKIHFCLYFLSPNTKRLQPRDIRALSVICDKVSVIPLIAKCDTLTPKELEALKKRIVGDIIENNISVFKFPTQDGQNQSVSGNNRKITPSDIFAVMGSDTSMEIAGKKSYCRTYPWGSVAVDNEKLSDFMKLKNLLILSSLHNVMKNTNKIYERYRTVLLCKEKGLEVHSINSSCADIAEATDAHLAKEAELEKNYQMFIEDCSNKLGLLEEKMLQELAAKQKEFEDLRESIEKKTVTAEAAGPTKDSDRDSKKKKEKDKKKRLTGTLKRHRSIFRERVKTSTDKGSEKPSLKKSESSKVIW